MTGVSHIPASGLQHRAGERVVAVEVTRMQAIPIQSGQKIPLPEGTALSDVALVVNSVDKTDVTAAEIIEFNAVQKRTLAPDGNLRSGTTVYLPKPTEIAAMRDAKAQIEPGKPYIVPRGSSLSLIAFELAKKIHMPVTAEMLATFNHIEDPKLLPAGKAINLPDASQVAEWMSTAVVPNEQPAVTEEPTAAPTVAAAPSSEPAVEAPPRPSTADFTDKDWKKVERLNNEIMKFAEKFGAAEDPLTKKQTQLRDAMAALLEKNAAYVDAIDLEPRNALIACGFPVQ
jgi:hypothetical protein